MLTTLNANAYFQPLTDQAKYQDSFHLTFEQWSEKTHSVLQRNILNTIWTLKHSSRGIIEKSNVQ